MAVQYREEADITCDRCGHTEVTSGSSSNGYDSEVYVPHGWSRVYFQSLRAGAWYRGTAHVMPGGDWLYNPGDGDKLLCDCCTNEGNVTAGDYDKPGAQKLAMYFCKLKPRAAWPLTPSTLAFVNPLRDLGSELEALTSIAIKRPLTADETRTAEVLLGEWMKQQAAQPGVVG